MGDRPRPTPVPILPAEEFRDVPADGSAVAGLLAAFETDYLVLLHRLSHRLRSQEAAEDALHDVYLKLRSEPDIGEIRNHRAYLYRMSLNLAKNHIRAQSRTMTVDDRSEEHTSELQSLMRISYAV